tara:strand:- start:683 stop:1399 length:717 start_codon:yes stop_codon:yes gene_type:complete
MADKKKKPKLTLVISVGPKMKTKPTDAATPDMKKYGSMPMKKAFQMLKQNQVLKRSDIAEALDNAPDNYALEEVMDNTDNYRRQEALDKYNRMKARKDKKMPQRPSPYSPASFPEDRPEKPNEGYTTNPYDKINEELPPRDVFGKAWDMLKGERGGLPSNFKRTKTSAMPEPEPMPKPEAEPETPTPQKVAAAKQQFDFINDIRRKRGEPPISIDEHLQQAGLKLEDYDREYHPEALE